MNPQQLQQFVKEVQQGFNVLSQRAQSATQVSNRQISGLRQRMFAIEAGLKLQAAGLKPRYPIEFRAQFSEDCLAYDLFKGKTDGYFIEVGAFDGYSYSVSYALECIGWTGLLIEGIPERAKACADRRKHARVVHAAVGKRGASGTTEFTVVADQYGGMLSYHTTDEQQKQIIENNKQKSTKVQVPLTSMDALLENDPELAKRGGEVDFAAIDVEGGELDLLDGFNLEKYRPKVMLLEENWQQNDDSPLAKYMKTKDYVFLGWLEVNRIYLRKDLASWQTHVAGGSW